MVAGAWAGAHWTVSGWEVEAGEAGVWEAGVWEVGGWEAEAWEAGGWAETAADRVHVEVVWAAGEKGGEGSGDGWEGVGMVAAVQLVWRRRRLVRGCYRCCLLLVLEEWVRQAGASSGLVGFEVGWVAGGAAEAVGSVVGSRAGWRQGRVL